MIITEFPRDLLMTGAIFGVAAFMWAGWAQERPPEHWSWRVVLGVLGLGGAVLAALTIPAVVSNWTQPTAIVFGGPAFAWYVAVFWLEVAAMVILVVLASRRKRSDLTAPLILAVVGIHFIPLSWVFMQPVLVVAGAVLTAAAVVAALVPDRAAARSFWCGLPGSGTLLIGGAACAAAGFGALG
ncbi:MULTISPECIES: hypothetical protein [unclassified Arthrobacter]|uniref:hypothetical protein n=1 Tax=unclassified Arthrobacter TaxID=235627 RepID=UPI001E5AC34F|nr:MULTISPECIES: hypothetical protein [unclassified Arthrobacter]MCC9145127.1 hypothetical protein [Arthrobacter sp. zg-Y919]MDK1276355.1 hypothetical protein [Arthrobacter sp. zg.Y919]WIB02042.1 hypothetical protein QNO10_08615 [Arthrobacter sp. zg-Y919]